MVNTSSVNQLVSACSYRIFTVVTLLGNFFSFMKVDL